LDEPIGNKARKTKPHIEDILNLPVEKRPSKFKPIPEHKSPGVFDTITRMFRRRPTSGGRKQKTRKNKGRKTNA